MIAAAHAALLAGDAARALELLGAPAAGRAPGWHILRARALAVIEGPAAAEAALRAGGDAPALRLALLRLLTRRLRAEEALAVASEDLAEAAPLRAQMLRTLGHHAQAAAAIREGIGRAREALTLEALFQVSAALHGHAPAHGEDRARLREALRALPPPASPRRAAAAARLSVRLHFAAGADGPFRTEAAALLAAGQAGQAGAVIEAILRPRPARPRVFVLGLSKTATSSMDVAFRRLGLVAAHFAHPVTNQMLRAEDGASIEAMSDTPVAQASEALAEAFPDARFILTLRPMDAWLRSVAAHFERYHRAGTIAALRALTEGGRPGVLQHWRELHHALYARHASFEEAYADHVERVRACFADRPGRLLEFDVFSGDGYPKLAAFLGLPAPDEPFPRVNVAPDP